MWRRWSEAKLLVKKAKEAALQAQDVALCAASDQSVDRVARVNLLGRQEELCWDAYMAVEYWVDLGALAAAVAARAWLWRAM